MKAIFPLQKDIVVDILRTVEVGKRASCAKSKKLSLLLLVITDCVEEPRNTPLREVVETRTS